MAAPFGPYAVRLWLPLVIYAGIAFAEFGTTGSWTSSYFSTGDVDAFAYMWFLNWWPFAICHQLNLFVSRFMWFPGGSNMTWDASVPVAALVGWPATAIFGPVATYNVLTVSAPALSAWTAFLLAWRISQNWAAAIVGGFIYGFSSFEIAQMIGHLNLDLIWLPPLIVLLCLLRYEGRLGARRFVAVMSIALLAQLGLSTEILLTSCIFGAIAWLVFFALNQRDKKDVLIRLGLEVAASGVIMAVLAAPFFFYLVKGLGDIPRQFNSAALNSADIGNYLIPTVVTRIRQAQFAAIANNFTGNPVEQGAYLGLPLIAMLVLYFRESIGNRNSRGLLIVLGLLVLCSLGPWLHLGAVETRVPLPWLIATKMPLISSIMPTRLTMYVSLCVGIAAAHWIAGARGRRARVWRLGLALIGCVALMPNPDVYPWTPVPVQPFFSAKTIRAVLGPMTNVLILPFGGDGPGSIWQIESGMQFTQSGGYLGYTPYHEALLPAMTDLYQGVPDPYFKQEFVTLCATHGIDFILIAPGAEPNLVAAVLAEGWKQRVEDQVTIIEVPKA